jgi:hypothetical protein
MTTKKLLLAVLLAATIALPVRAQTVQLHIPFLNFRGFSRPETVVAVYFKQVDGSVVWLDLNARHAAVVEPDATFRLSWQESRISWFLDGGYGYGYDYGYGYGWRNYDRKVRFTANVCPAESVIRQEVTRKVKGADVSSVEYGCTSDKFTFSSGDFVVSDPQYFPQQVSILYFCGAWSSGYWLSDKGCPVTVPQLSPVAAATSIAPVSTPQAYPAPHTSSTQPIAEASVLFQSSSKYFEPKPSWRK